MKTKKATPAQMRKRKNAIIARLQDMLAERGVGTALVGEGKVYEKIVVLRG